MTYFGRGHFISRFSSWTIRKWCFFHGWLLLCKWYKINILEEWLARLRSIVYEDECTFYQSLPDECTWWGLIIRNSAVSLYDIRLFKSAFFVGAFWASRARRSYEISREAEEESASWHYVVIPWHSAAVANDWRNKQVFRGKKNDRNVLQNSEYFMRAKLQINFLSTIFCKESFFIIGKLAQ